MSDSGGILVPIHHSTVPLAHNRQQQVALRAHRTSEDKHAEEASLPGS